MYKLPNLFIETFILNSLCATKLLLTFVWNKGEICTSWNVSQAVRDIWIGSQDIFRPVQNVIGYIEN